MKNVGIFASVALATILSLAASAQTVGTSEASTGSELQKFMKEKGKLSAGMEYVGTKGDAFTRSGSVVDYYLGMGYKINKDLYVDFNPAFEMSASASDADGDRNRWTILDPYARIGLNNIVNKDGFSLGTQMRYYIPVSRAARDGNSMGTIQNRTTQSYQFKDSKWSLSNMVRTSFIPYSANANTGRTYSNGKQRTVWAFDLFPTVGYQALKDLALALEFRHTLRGKQTIGQEDTLGTKRQRHYQTWTMYFYWTPMDKLLIEPYITMDLGSSKDSFAAADFGVYRSNNVSYNLYMSYTFY